MAIQRTETEILNQVETIKNRLRELDRQSEKVLPILAQKAISEEQRTLNDRWNKLNQEWNSFYGDW